jgi:hypothetical protein
MFSVRTVFSARTVLVLAVGSLVACVVGDNACLKAVCEKTFEGLAGGLLVGLVPPLTNLSRVGRLRLRPLKLALRHVRQEAFAGMAGGLMLGLARSFFIHFFA